MASCRCNASELPMDESQEIDRVAASLARRNGTDADAAQIADTVSSTFKEIDAALVPIIGHRGVVALRKRSLHVAAKAHPWLKDVVEGSPADLDATTLGSVIAAQTSADAAQGGAALLLSFYALLASLIGLSLTERLLRTVWIRFLNAQPPQDTSP